MFSALLSLQVPQEVPGGDGPRQGGLLDRRCQPAHLLRRSQGFRLLCVAIQAQIGKIRKNLNQLSFEFGLKKKFLKLKINFFLQNAV